MADITFFSGPLKTKLLDNTRHRRPVGKLNLCDSFSESRNLARINVLPVVRHTCRFAVRMRV